jgi:hypothetical protein
MSHGFNDDDEILAQRSKGSIHDATVLGERGKALSGYGKSHSFPFI